jgi:hypothetical protein
MQSSKYSNLEPGGEREMALNRPQKSAKAPCLSWVINGRRDLAPGCPLCPR